jgi:hypothetical protein
MLYPFKKALLCIVMLFLFQVGGYFLFAKQQLPEVIVQNRRTLVVEEPAHVFFTSEQVLSDQQADNVTLVLQQSFPVVNPDRQTLDSLPEELYCSYHFNINQPLPCLATVTYSNVYSSTGDDSAYAESYKSAYIWILYCWWEIENKNTGQS